MEYNLIEPWKSLEPWQVEVKEAQGNVVVRSGRQVGKSTAISVKAGDFAIKNARKSILIIAAVERQAYLLFEKVIAYVRATKPNMIKSGKHRPTKSKLELTNGSIIRCLPTGLTGHGIRGFTIDLLIADEAAFIPSAVWAAVTPMLAITKGKMILLSTPYGREGFFYQCFQDETFKRFHISSEDCPRRDDNFLKQEKNRMTRLQYAQEYLGEFVDDLRQFFPTDLIRKIMCLSRGEDVYSLNHISPSKALYLGVDVARMGGDESTFEILDLTNRKKIIHVDSIVTTEELTTTTANRIIRLNRKYNFRRIYIDDGGLGVAVLDQLLQEPETRRKVEAVNNASRDLNKDGTKKKSLKKEDLYMNLLRLMERNEISLLDDDEIFRSLKSVQYEYDDGKLKIFGRYTHIVEGLIRAAWAAKDKRLNIYKY